MSCYLGSRTHADDGLEAAHRMDELRVLLPPISSEQIVEQALNLTRDYGVTFYDAAYHALALVERGEFVTADSGYVGKTQAAGAVSLLGA